MQQSKYLTSGQVTTDEDNVRERIHSGSPAPRWGELLTAEEAATYLKCHVSTVYDLVNRGRLKGFSLTGNTQKNKRGKKGLRILATSANDLVTRGLEEREGPGGDVPHLRPEPAVAVLPTPAKTRVKKPVRGSGSRVVLPFPGGTS